MEKCIVISDGDKIKAIREKYNLKQDEISGNDITRNLISEIETNKANITKKTAEVIIKNLTELGKKNGFKVTETVEYLMENQIVQATKVLDSYIEELKTLVISKDGNFIEILKKAEGFLIDWDIRDKKIKIYELAGDYFCSNNEMYKSAVYYEKASALLSRRFLDKKLIPLSRKLSMVYVYMGNYEKSIECCEFALNNFLDMSISDIITFRYNNALNYKNINNFNIALENIKIAERLVDKEDKSTYIRILNNKANCLYKKSLYTEALVIYDEISNIITQNEVEEYLINSINIISNYIGLDLRDKVVEKLNIMINQLPNLNNNSSCIADIYFDVGRAYKYINKIKEEEKYYLKALNFAKKRKRYNLVNEILSVLIEIYSKSNDTSNISNISKIVFSISDKQEKISNTIMYKLIKFYSQNGNIDEISNIADYALKFE